METTNPRKAGELILNKLSMFNEAVILMEEQITVKIFSDVRLRTCMMDFRGFFPL